MPFCFSPEKKLLTEIQISSISATRYSSIVIRLGVYLKANFRTHCLKCENSTLFEEAFVGILLKRLFLQDDNKAISRTDLHIYLYTTFSYFPYLIMVRNIAIALIIFKQHFRFNTTNHTFDFMFNANHAMLVPRMCASADTTFAHLRQKARNFMKRTSRTACNIR